MSVLAIVLYVLGALLISTGITLIILTYTTKLFYTKITSIQAGEVSRGSELYNYAYMVWDETHLQLDANKLLYAWDSNSSYSDALGAPGAAYRFVIAVDLMETRTSNSGTKGPVPLPSTEYLMNFLISNDATQPWPLFPKSNFSIMVVGSGPATEIPLGPQTLYASLDGLGIRLGIKNVACGLCFNYNKSIYSSSPNNVMVLKSDGCLAIQPIQAKTYTSTNGQIYSANTLGLTYTTATDRTCKTYLNGQKITFNTPGTTNLPDDKIPNPINFGTSSPFTVGANEFSTTSAYFAVLVFNRVLNDSEMSDLSAYLVKKYFAPQLRYPTTITLNVNEPLSAPIANTLVDGADAILNYSITPLLPAGLVFNTSLGTITGAARIGSPMQDYTITATNGTTFNTCKLSLSVIQTVNTVTPLDIIPPPFISVPADSTYIYTLNSFVSTPTPKNTGGAITVFSISPANVTESTGLTFDATAGILTGTASKTANIKVSITATNLSGSSTLALKIVIGRNIEYPTDVIQDKLGNIVQNVPIAIWNASGLAITFYSTGNLLGLTLDAMTGVISGKTTSFGKSNVIVYAKTPDNSVFASTKIMIDIKPTEELKNKSTYLAAGGVMAGIGATTLGVAGYLTYSNK